jgi:hypothetical protein
MTMTITKYTALAAASTFCVVAAVWANVIATSAPSEGTDPPDTPQTLAASDMQLAPYSNAPVPVVVPVVPVVAPTPVKIAQAPHQIPRATTNAGCSLSLTLASDKSKVNPGDELTYTLAIASQGNSVCANASVSVYYADNVHFRSADPKPTASNYYWVLGDMAPGQSKKVTIHAAITEVEGELAIQQTQSCVAADNGNDACSTTSTTAKSGVATNITIPQTPVKVIDGAQDKEYGTWIWTSPINMSQDDMRSAVDEAAKNGMNAVYVTIDDYLEIQSLPESAAKTARAQSYSDALDRFIRTAQEKGIAVDVEVGWRDWSEDSSFTKAFVMTDYAVAFNKTHSHTIRALQFDVEPYLLATYEANKANILKRYVALVDATVNRLGTESLGLSIVIPHFYDEAQGWTPAFAFNGSTAHAFTHLMNGMDARPNGKIIVMAYRNFSENDNGTISLAQGEIDEASAGTHATKVIVAQETGDIQPGYVTFFGKSKSEYASQVELIKAHFKTKSGFGGIAVHYLDAFMKLKD